MNHRSTLEKRNYDEGNVLENNSKIHNLFSHVFSSPNTIRGEDLFSSLLKKASCNKKVLEIGCGDGSPDFVGFFASVIKN